MNVIGLMSDRLIAEWPLIALGGVVLAVLPAGTYAKTCSHILKPFKKYKIPFIQSILQT